MEACALPRATSAWGSPKDAESAASASVGVTEEDYPPSLSLLRQKRHQSLLFSVKRYPQQGHRAVWEPVQSLSGHWAQQGLQIHKSGGCSIPVLVCSTVVRVPGTALCQHESRDFPMGGCLQPRAFLMGRYNSMREYQQEEIVRPREISPWGAESESCTNDRYM